MTGPNVVYQVKVSAQLKQFIQRRVAIRCGHSVWSESRADHCAVGLIACVDSIDLSQKRLSKQ